MDERQWALCLFGKASRRRIFSRSSCSCCLLREPEFFDDLRSLEAAIFRRFGDDDIALDLLPLFGCQPRQGILDLDWQGPVDGENLAQDDID